MSKHITLAIQEVRQQISGLQDTERALLRALSGGKGSTIGSRTGRVISPEAREKMRLSQQARWNKIRASKAGDGKSEAASSEVIAEAKKKRASKKK